MQTNGHRPSENPLAGLISDEAFQVLKSHDLLSKRAIRDYRMRMQFRAMRREKVPASVAIERLKDAHPYLQVDTIRKIVYHAGNHR